MRHDPCLPPVWGLVKDVKDGQVKSKPLQCENRISLEASGNSMKD